MLFEIFSDRIYEETLCDPEHGIESKKVPHISISEPDSKLRERYNIVLNFLHNIISDTNRFHMLEIDYDAPKLDSTTVSIARSYSDENYYAFNFKFDNIGKDISTPITGIIRIDEYGNLIEYKRNANQKKQKYACQGYNDNGLGGNFIVSCVENTTDPLSTRYPNNHPFTSRNQSEEESQNNSIDCVEESSTDIPPVELSSNSFDVDGNVLNISDPELEIGTVDEKKGVLNVDADKQALQDAFLKNMNKKYRNTRH